MIKIKGYEYLGFKADRDNRLDLDHNGGASTETWRRSFLEMDRGSERSQNTVVPFASQVILRAQPDKTSYARQRTLVKTAHKSAAVDPPTHQVGLTRRPEEGMPRRDKKASIPNLRMGKLIAYAIPCLRLDNGVTKDWTPSLVGLIKSAHAAYSFNLHLSMIHFYYTTCPV